MDCIVFYFHFFIACISDLSQSAGLGGTFEYDLHNIEISLVCVSLFSLSLLKIPLGVCVEMGVNVTECLGWLEEREMYSAV